VIRNHFVSTDSGIVIFIRRRCGEVVEILVDQETFLEKLQNLDARAYLTTSASGLSYASLLIRLSSGKFEKKLLHRHITDAPKGRIVDHINRDTHDNRLVNLRLVGNRESMQNRNLQSNNTTGERGVTRRPSGKYCARVRRDRKVVYYEQFESFSQAVEAIRKMRSELLPFSDDTREIVAC